MPVELPDLPAPIDTLEPAFSARTLPIHHGSRHRACVRGVNLLVRGIDLEGRPLAAVVAGAMDQLSDWELASCNFVRAAASASGAAARKPWAASTSVR